MKRMTSVFLAILLAFGVSGCGAAEAKPEDTVNSFLVAAQSLDFEKMATYMSAADTDALSELHSADETEQYFMDYLKDAAAKMTYTIQSSEMNGDAAAVTVDFKYIDSTPVLTAVIGEVFTKAFASVFSGTELTDEQMNAMFAEALAGQQRTMEDAYVESTVTIDCAKVDGVWVIDSLDDDFANVIMANFVKASEEISNSFGGDALDESAPETAAEPQTGSAQPGETTGQANARRAAENYLSFTAFSHDGLIAQLEYEGYSTEDATYAADGLGADWDEQALASAQNYLSYSAFSYSGLIDQLEYEKFTADQAAYAADHCGADWNEQAAKAAESYLSYSAFSKDSLIDQLEYSGFTSEQAVYGAQANGY